MKAVIMLLIISAALTACGPGSSPEGRMTTKLDELKQQLDSLKTQNREMKDSLTNLSALVRGLKK